MQRGGGGGHQELLMNGDHLSLKKVEEFGAEVRSFSSVRGREGAEQSVDGGEQGSGVILL